MPLYAVDMSRHRTRRVMLSMVVIGSIACAAPAADPIAGGLTERVKTLRVADGLAISLYAEGVANARQMALGDQGTLFVGSRRAGRVHAVLDRDGDHRADEVILIASGLRQPSGLAFRNGSLYVAEIPRILRYDDIEDRLEDPPEPVVVSDALPGAGHHGWRYLKFSPDGVLHVSVGAPCNVCDGVPLKSRGGWGGADPELFASIARVNLETGEIEPYAFGIRNSVGFDWHPGTGYLVFTDNGRDMMGDNVPPDELNVATKAGQHFGFPYCHGGDVPDPEYGSERPCSDFRPPAQKLGPHVASIGMTVISGDTLPPEYRGRAVIAEHGSWNRSTPIGYRVMTVTLDGDRGTAYEPLVEGWLLRDGRAWGRPSDVLELPDGSLLVADDRADAIYRISADGG